MWVCKYRIGNWLWSWRCLREMSWLYSEGKEGLTCTCSSCLTLFRHLLVPQMTLCYLQEPQGHSNREVCPCTCGKNSRTVYKEFNRHTFPLIFNSIGLAGRYFGFCFSHIDKYRFYFLLLKSSVKLIHEHNEQDKPLI